MTDSFFKWRVLRPYAICRQGPDSLWNASLIASLSFPALGEGSLFCLAVRLRTRCARRDATDVPWSPVGTQQVQPWWIRMVDLGRCRATQPRFLVAVMDGTGSKYVSPDWLVIDEHGPVCSTVMTDDVTVWGQHLWEVPALKKDQLVRRVNNSVSPIITAFIILPSMCPASVQLSHTQTLSVPTLHS